MTFIHILIVAIWKSRQVFRAYGWGNMPLQAVKLPISHNNVVGENIVLQLNILETGVLTHVVHNSSPTRLRLVGDEFWTTRVRTPVSKMFRWRTYNSPHNSHSICANLFIISMWYQIRNMKVNSYISTRIGGYIVWNINTMLIGGIICVLHMLYSALWRYCTASPMYQFDQ